MRRSISRWRLLLDVITTACVAAIAVAVVWTSLIRTPRVVAANESRTSKATRPEPPLPTTSLSLEGAAIDGSKQARVALIVYSDFQCPYCAKVAGEVLPALHDKYVRPGTVQIAFRHFPLSIHAMAQKAAEAAECAGEQGMFWNMHDALFRDPKKLAMEDLVARARDLKLDGVRFTSCLDGNMTSKVRTDAAVGRTLDVRGTPAFFLGTVQTDGRVKVARRLSGAQSFTTFESALDRVLKTGAE